MATQSSFEAEFSGLGVFPNPKRPSVLWVGVDRGKRYLRELHQEVMASLLPLGYKPERQPFHPHLTLARIKSMRGTAGLRDVIEAHRRAECGSCPITRVVLFRSELHKAGPVYTLFMARLRGESITMARWTWIILSFVLVAVINGLAVFWPMRMGERRLRRLTA